MESFTLPSFAKINLQLRILGKRDDGFHELFTIFQTVSLYDEITFAPAEGLRFSCDRPEVPDDERNLIVKAAIALGSRFGINKGADIYLKKNIPAPGGLGGGSSNAATALIGLSRLWKIEPTLGDLEDMAAALGSDVPFFLQGGTAIGTGRGERIENTRQVDEKYLLIVTPDVDVPTREAFARVNAPRLTPESLKSNLIVCRLEAETLDLRHTQLKNDFERSVFEFAPEVERVKKRLLELGAAQSLMSGSGASVFGIFDTEETRQATLKALEYELKWRKFVVAAISRNKYREALKIAY